jgi:ABC-2 type transport system permease protein
MTLMVQAAVLLVSGVYYRVEVLPPWLRVLSFVSPATYILDGLRGAIQHGRSTAELWPELALLAGYGALLIPLSLAAFAAAERWAKRTGRLKRSG